MITFMSAYLIVWLGVVLFVGRLTMKQHNLERTLKSLETTRTIQDETLDSTAKAA